MIRDLEGDVARFSTPSPNGHDVLLGNRDPGLQQLLPDVHEENGSHPGTWSTNFQSGETADIFDSGRDQLVFNITMRPMAICGYDLSRPNTISQTGGLVGSNTTTVPNASGSDGYASVSGKVPRNQPAPMPVTTLSSTSSDSSQIPPASAKPGRCPPSHRGVTGAKGGNGLEILSSSAERPTVHPLIGNSSIRKEDNASSQQAKNMYAVAYCYQSTYSLKSNSNLLDGLSLFLQYYFITKGTLSPQYAQTIVLPEAPRMAKF